jgi:hypothetical protein
MRRTALSALLCAGITALGQASSGQPANHPVISELRYRQHSGVNEEFVEIYNPMPRAVNLSGWSLAYKKKTGGNWDVKVVFRRGQALRPGGYFLWGGTAVNVPPDTAETGASRVGLGNSGGNIALRDQAGNDVDRVAWEGGDSAEGRPAAGKNVEGGSLERKAHAGSTGESMSPGGADASAGNGYDTDDNETDFVLHNHFAEIHPQNSGSPSEPEGGWPMESGRCDVTPLSVQVCDTTDLRFTFRPDTAAALTGLVIAAPRGIGWPFQGSDIRFEGKESAYAGTVVSGDTIRIDGLFLLFPDSGSVILPRFAMPALPDSLAFPVWFVFREGLRLPAVRPPVVEVRPAVMPAIRLHANDAGGVPAPPFRVGTRVMVSGVLTAGRGTFFSNRIFLQDETAGLSLSGDGMPENLSPGDSITVTGVLSQIRGLTELRPDWSTLCLHGSEFRLPQPADITCAEVNASFRDNGFEPDESRLVRIPRVVFDPETGTVSDGTGAARLWIDSGAGAEIPRGPFNAVGLLMQEKSGIDEPPYTSDYGVMPRYQSDMMPLEDTSAVAQSGRIEVRPAQGSFGLLPNNPNPFNGETLIRFSLPSAGRIRLSIFDARGRQAALLPDNDFEKGIHAVRWDGTDGAGHTLPSGVYVLRIAACGEVRFRKILMVR